MNCQERFGETCSTNRTVKSKERKLSNKSFPNRFMTLKKDMVNLIMQLLVEEKIIYEVPGFEEINLSTIKKEELIKNYSIEELAIMLSSIEYQYCNKN